MFCEHDKNLDIFKTPSSFKEIEEKNNDTEEFLIFTTCGKIWFAGDPSGEKKNISSSQFVESSLYNDNRSPKKNFTTNQSIQKINSNNSQIKNILKNFEYPIFKEIAEQCCGDDPYWYEIFYKMSLNKFHKNMKFLLVNESIESEENIKNFGKLIVKKKNKTNFIYIEKDIDINELFLKIKKFLGYNLSFFSSKDKKKNNTSIDEIKAIINNEFNNTFSEKNRVIEDNTFSEKNRVIEDNTFSEKNRVIEDNTFSEKNRVIEDNTFSEKNRVIEDNTFSEKKSSYLKNNTSISGDSISLTNGDMQNIKKNCLSNISSKKINIQKNYYQVQSLLNKIKNGFLEDKDTFYRFKKIANIYLKSLFVQENDVFSLKNNKIEFLNSIFYDKGKKEFQIFYTPNLKIERDFKERNEKGLLKFDNSQNAFEIIENRFYEEKCIKKNLTKFNLTNDIFKYFLNLFEDYIEMFIEKETPFEYINNFSDKKKLDLNEDKIFKIKFLYPSFIFSLYICLKENKNEYNISLFNILKSNHKYIKDYKKINFLKIKSLDICSLKKKYKDFDTKKINKLSELKINKKNFSQYYEGILNKIINFYGFC